MTKLVKIQIAMAVPLILVGGFFAFYIYLQVTKSTNNTLINISPAEVFYNQLNGTATSEISENIYPTAVMIENHIDARPQSGIFQAKIVYEILAESDITRFLAIYDLTENLSKIGPVRSARPYYIDIASEYQSLYAHSGGSPDALKRLKSDKLVFNLDEFFGYNTGYFERDNNRYAPHNLYTSSELMLKAKEHYDILDYPEFQSWTFKAGESASSNDQQIKIYYSEAPAYQVIWQYLKDNNKYERWQNDKRHIDDENNIIEADNIIIQYAKSKILDSVGRKDIELIGSGRAIVFRDGISIDGSWQKKDTAARTVFYDVADNEIELNRGKIWIEVVSNDIKVEY